MKSLKIWKKKKIDAYIPSSSPEIPLNFCEEPRNSQFEKV